MAPLVEARRDGRLAPRDVASLDRHLATCAACRSLDDDLARIGEHIRAPLPPASPLEHQRARVAILRRAAEGTPRVAPRPWPIRAIAVAATLAAVVLGLWIASVPSRTPPIAQQSAPMLAPQAPASAQPNLRTETTVHPEPGARFSRTTGGGLDLVTLLTGAINVGVRPLTAGERFIVQTDDAEVEVRGTLFRVEADRGHIVSVIVTEGKVEVRSRGTSALVPAGGDWHATPQSAEQAPYPPSPLSPDFGGKGERHRAPSHPPKSGEGGPRATGADAPPQVSSSSAPPPADQTSKQFADALKSMEKGDYPGAATRLNTFHEAHPDDARAEEATYLDAIALQRAGHAPEAAEAARRYLARYPNGSFRTEAAAIAAPR